MKRSKKVVVAALALSVIPASWAIAGFTPKFNLKLTDLSTGANPNVKVHLEFDANDEEIGNFTMRIPAGELRGLSILSVPVHEARRLKEADEAVRAGVFSVRVLPWRIPAGAMSFSRTFFPRSMRDVTTR
jgi:hypothetical protein